jgi:uncharacterized protein (DUF433 family)
MTTHRSAINLSSGIYTLPDAARILRLPLAKLRRWVGGYYPISTNKVREPQKHYGVGNYFSEGEGREKHFNFHTMIELYTVGKMRERGISAKTIREFKDDLSERFETDYPFALKGLMLNGKKLIAEMKDKHLLEVGSGGIVNFDEILRPFCQNLDFDPTSDLVKSYHPDGRTSAVIIDPQRSFGRPVIGLSNITTEAIASLVRGGETLEDIADDFELELNQVKDAWNFENQDAA